MLFFINDLQVSTNLTVIGNIIYSNNLPLYPVESEYSIILANAGTGGAQFFELKFAYSWQSALK
jgi:hypothetical protein